ncbi:hypothetical protein FGO68_gene7018 [Halteria grandinella]|uniref:EF-hand domain-containing protein n=1 Tax=Halteria grandinella TaxID=5974 RepID=A0A8J8T2K2_HALGN|nr:hypothetical protein FGO68_gene7018 [Halteria grandinella]
MELVPKAAQVQQEAGSEVDAKEGMEKLKAIKNLALLVKQVQSEIPEAMKRCLKEVEDEVNEVKELQQALQVEGELALIAEDGKKCHEAKVFSPPTDVYRHIYGTVTETKRGVPKPKKEDKATPPPTITETPAAIQKNSDHTPVAAGPASGTTDSSKGHQEVTVAEVMIKVAEAKLEPTQDWYDDYEDHAHDAEEEYDTHNYYYGGKQIPLETTLSLLMLKKAIPINLYFNRRESQKQDEFEKQIALVIDQIWSQFDKDGSGQLNRKECREFFDESNRQMNGASQKITDEEFNAAFTIVDQNGSGLISKDEMKTFIKYIAGYK